MPIARDAVKSIAAGRIDSMQHFLDRGQNLGRRKLIAILALVSDNKSEMDAPAFGPVAVDRGKAVGRL